MLPDFRIRQRDYLLEIAQALTQELDLDKLLSRILKISIEMLAGHAGLITTRSEMGVWLVQVSQGIPAAFIKFLEPYLERIPLSGENSGESEIPEINRLLKELTRTASYGLLTGVGLPLITQGKVLGIIFIFRNYPGIFSTNDRLLLSSFANQAAIAVHNAQLYTQVTREKHRMDALLDSAADGILILTPEQQVELCNHALVMMLGKKLEEVQGRFHEEVIRWEKPPEGMTLEKAVAGGWPLTPHAHLYIEGDMKRNAPYPPLPIGVTYAPLFSEDGILLNTIATVRDITRFRQAEELKSTFISIISHELKTPVALIKGYVSTLRREDARWDRAIVQDSLKVIEDETDRLASLIDNLLDASRLQADRTKLNRTDACIPDMARKLVQRLQVQSDKHKIRVEFPSDFPIILADENRIQQVLSNLIGNAIKYSPEGEIRISGQTRDEFIIICISDEGPGISPEDIPHVFDRFYRSPNMARQTQGAGLGLFLVRTIIEAHGGKIWVDTETGKGTRICFTLPKWIDNQET